MCINESLKAPNISSLDQTKSSNEDAIGESGRQKTNISKMLRNIFRSNVNKEGSDLLEQFPSREFEKNKFSRFRQKDASIFVLEDVSKSLEYPNRRYSMDYLPKNLARNRKHVCSNRSSKNTSEEVIDHDPLDVARNGLQNKPIEMDTSVASYNNPNQVIHAKLNHEQLDILKKFSKPCLSKSYNLVRERVRDINNQDIESRRNASLRLALDLAGDNFSSNCSDAPETKKQYFRSYNTL